MSFVRVKDYAFVCKIASYEYLQVGLSEAHGYLAVMFLSLVILCQTNSKFVQLLLGCHVSVPSYFVPNKFKICTAFTWLSCFCR